MSDIEPTRTGRIIMGILMALMILFVLACVWAFFGQLLWFSVIEPVFRLILEATGD